MAKKIFIFVTIAGFLTIGIRAAYLKDYETVLKYPEENTKLFFSQDSITIVPHLFVENVNTLGAVINFESVKDSLFLENINVSVYSSDNPHQSIVLQKVSTPIRPITNTNGDLEKLDVYSFNDLPLYYKTIRWSGSPYNVLIFYFNANQIRQTDFYYFKISGKFLYKGQEFSFEKEIKTERKLEYHPYQMMT
jgi:hypothetical protein